MIFSQMLANLDDSPTRRKIVWLLNKKRHMTVTEISREMGITPMAVRQHLLSLEKRSMVSFETRKNGIGRPVYIYRLTDKAGDYFPKAYSRFLDEILQAVEKVDGKKKIDRLLSIRNEMLIEEMNGTFSKVRKTSDRLALLADILSKKGHVIELEESRKKFTMKNFNCLTPEISARYPEVCNFELDLVKHLVGKNVRQTDCQRNGDPSCTYEIARE